MRWLSQYSVLLEVVEVLEDQVEGEVVVILLMEVEVEGPDLLEEVAAEQEGLRRSELTY